MGNILQVRRAFRRWRTGVHCYWCALRKISATQTSSLADDPVAELESTDRPRCDHLPLWSTSEHRCPHPAAVRVFRSHGAGENPVYKDRCMWHASSQLGPEIAAWWDEEEAKWAPTI